MIVVCTQLTDSFTVAVHLHSTWIAQQWKHVINAKCINGYQVMDAIMSQYFAFETTLKTVQ